MTPQPNLISSLDQAIVRLDQLVTELRAKDEIFEASKVTTIIVKIESLRSNIENRNYHNVVNELEDSNEKLKKVLEASAETQNQIEALAAIAGLIARVVTLV